MAAKKCPACKARAFNPTGDTFESIGESVAVWLCDQCGHKEGRPTGKKASAGTPSHFHPRDE